ncbi:MAG TPA: methyltransferase domain-containing protein, partial [Steroidobacteraceae bacterium]|nr:methyltransferase domain-containing protein [Steroidobacteraceae bacterium]
MRIRSGTALAAVAILALADCTSFAARSAVTGRLDRAIAGTHRDAAERARDIYRHPRETLLFFGLRPDQTVVEILPIGGWYTKIVAPVVRGHGNYIAAMPPATPGNANSENSRQAYLSILASAPTLLDKVQVVDFDPGAKPMVPDGTADLVLTFRNIHNWMSGNRAEAAFRDMYRALKPGGTLGVTEHRGNEAVPQDPRARSGYVNQSYAIKLIESVGFRLVGTSEVNANPRDSKD